MKNFILKLIAPDGVKYEAEANAVILPTTEGQIEILPGHMNLVTLISAGEIIIKLNGETKYLATEGGVAEVSQGLVKILADTAQEAHNLDEFKIAEAKKAAEERLANAKDAVEYANAAAHLEKQIMMAKIAAKRRRR